MRSYNSIRGVWVGVVVLGAVALGLALASGCGSKNDGNPTGPQITTVPAAWGGLWTFTTTTKYCPPSGQVISTDTEVDTLCVGKPVEQEFEFSGSGCTNGTVTATATTLSFSCSQATTEGGCTGNLSISMNATVNTSAGTITGTGQMTFHPTGGTNCPPSDICIDIIISGTRTSTAQPGCSTAKSGMFGKLLPRLESVLSQGGS